MYRFEHQWFGQNIPNLQKLFNGYNGEPQLKILEIGSLEGLSTTWFLDNVKNCHVTCIDTWSGGVDHDPNNSEINFQRIKENFDHNVSFHKGRVRQIQSYSYDALLKLYQEQERFDFVFVDGSHTALDVNADLVLSWRLLKPGSLIYCDDYFWGFNDTDLQAFPKLNSVYDSPKLGIDSFVNVYRNKLKPVIGMENVAAVFIKVSE